MYVPGNWNYWFNIGSNPKKKLTATAGASINDGFKNYLNAVNYFANITYKPVNSFNLSLMPSFTTYDTELQYVDSYTYLNDDKYIFGSLDQKTFNLTIRVNYNITPDLSVQYYGSPFISSVLYDKFKKITHPKADEYYDRYHVYNSNEIFYERGVGYLIDESGDGMYDYRFFKSRF